MKKTLLIVGIVLLILQSISTVSGIAMGTLNFTGVFILDFAFLLGYHFIGIVGVILLVIRWILNNKN